MNNIHRSISIAELRRDIAAKERNLSRLKEMSNTSVGIKNLMEEDNLEQAKLIIASQDVIEKLQKIAERLAELNAEEIMPLSDSMKAAFGPDIAQKFEHVASESIQRALESVRAAKDAIDNAILQVEGKTNPEDQTDMASNPVPDVDTTVDDTTIDTPTGDDTILSTDTEDENTTSGGDNNPLGRSLRDSVDYTILGMAALSESTCSDLCSWMLREARKKMPHNKFVSFGKNLMESAKKNEVYTSGWIYKKMNESFDPNLVKAKAIAHVIENNLKTTGKSNTSKVVSKFLGSDLNEDSSVAVLNIFEETFGCNPAIYSARLKREMSEDTGSIASTLVKGINPDTTTGGSAQTSNTNSSPNPSQEDNEQRSAVTKIAASVANNPGALYQPITSVFNNLSPSEKTALNNKIGSNTSMSVDDFLKSYNQGSN